MSIDVSGTGAPSAGCAGGGAGSAGCGADELVFVVFGVDFKVAEHVLGLWMGSGWGRIEVLDADSRGAQEQLKFVINAFAIRFGDRWPAAETY